jgi:hypothetical protein
VLVEQLALQAGEERFGDEIVEAIADGAHRAEQPRVAEPGAEMP